MLNDNYYFHIPSLGNLYTYIKIVNSWPVLSSKEETELFQKYFHTNNLDVIKVLILYHLRYVVYFAKHYSGYNIPLADLIQEGNIGLIIAIKKFNPLFKVRLISFAVYWIKSLIYNYIIKNWRIVKIATTNIQRRLFFNIRKYKLYNHIFYKQELMSLANKLKISSIDIINMELKMLSHDIHLSCLLKYNKRYSNIVLSAINHNYYTDFTFLLEQMNWKIYILNKLYHAISFLDIRSKHIIYFRWLHNKKYTLIQLAKCYGLTAERIRQLEKKAINKLKIYLLN